ncbi:helix-turn-helix domain-containing protein [Streptomyces sp. NBC_00208]
MPAQPPRLSSRTVDDALCADATHTGLGPLLEPLRHPATLSHPGINGFRLVATSERLPPPNDEGRRLLRIVRRGTGSVVTWRRAQMVLLSAQSMAVVKIAEVTFTSPDRVRDLIHDFNTDGFDSLYPKYKGGRPKSFTLPERREVKKISKSKPVEHGLPFSTWSLVKLADFLVAEDVVDDISHEGLRVLLREEGLSIQRSTCEDLEDLDRPELCGEEVQGRAPLRHRRW